MQGLNATKIMMYVELVGDVESGANFDIFLREVVCVNERLTDLVGVIGILAVVGIIAICEESRVAALDCRNGVGLNFIHYAEDFPNLDIEGRFGAEKDISVRV